MRIKRSIMGSYVVVILLPIIIALLSSLMIIKNNREARVRDYVTNTFLIQKYSKILDDVSLYEGDHDFDSLIESEDRDLVDIALYNYDGRLIYKSNIENVNELNRTEPKDSLLKGLYERVYELDNDSIKRPVYRNDKIIGVYNIAIHRVEFVNKVNNIIMTGIFVFIGSLVLLFIFANRFTENRINKPIQKLVFAMNEFASDRFVKISSRDDDEIGAIISNFNRMRDDIRDKSYQIRNDHAERNYMVMAISHDLKTPLTAIRTNIELIRENGECDLLKLDGIIEKCDLMSSMLDNLMNYNLLQSGGEIEPVTVDGKEAIDTLFFGYKDLIENAGLSSDIDVKIEGEYNLDVNQMDRVIGNLIINAIKYCKPGGQISLGVYSEEYELPDHLDPAIKARYSDLKDKMLIIVKNDTARLSEEQLKKISYPFYKLDDSRSKERGGIGLGLSIAVLIVDKHDGEVDFYSEEDNLTIVIELNRNRNE